MKMTTYTTIPHGVVVETNEGFRLRLEAWQDNIIRMSCTTREFPEDNSAIVIGKAADIAFTVEDTDADFLFSAGTAAVKIHKPTFGIRLFRDGEEVVKLSRWGMQLRDTAVTIPHHTADRTTTDKLKLVNTEELPGYKFYLSMDLPADEQIYGLGQQDVGTLNRREAPVYLYQTNNQAPVPFFVSSKGYGMLVDTGSFASFERDAFGTTFYAEAMDMGDVYFVAGHTCDESIKGYRTLTGETPMMPKWFFGYTQSKERYSTAEELVGIVDEYRRRRVPLDLVVQDWSYWPEGTWSDKSFDAARYPDPTAMCKAIHDRHAHVMISVWPNTRGGDCFKELFEKDQLLTDDGTFGGGGVYNVFDDGACETYWNQLNNGIFRHGFDGWWCDATEPFEPQYGSFNRPDEQKSVTMDVYRRWMDTRKVNLFALLQSRSVYNRQRQVTTDKRVVNLTRSGYAGQQHYGTVVWSGDIGGTFEEMRAQIAEGLNFCASGLPYWSLDIGGFWSKKGGGWYNVFCPYDSNQNPGYQELYTRWIQFGCFLPLFRSHGTCFGREIWQFGEEGGLFYDAIRKFIELRYRLMPYIYSLAWQVTKNGATFIRPLAFDFAADPKALVPADTYMFGREFLVSPVTTPQYFEDTDVALDVPKTKDVYLPAGADWYDFWTEKKVAGGQTVTVDTPIDSMPLFVRAGSIIPTTQPMQYADEIPDAPYTVLVYPGADAAFTVYEDAGDGYDYEQGAYATYTLQWNDADKTLTVSDREGGFEGLCEERDLQIRVVGQGETTIRYTGKESKVSF